MIAAQDGLSHEYTALALPADRSVEMISYFQRILLLRRRVPTINDLPPDKRVSYRFVPL